MRIDINKNYLLIFVLILLFISISFSFITFERSAGAISSSDFKAGRLIDDSVFYNKSSLSPSQIQKFLEAKVPFCDTNGTQMYNSTQTRAQWAAANAKPLPPYTCLKDYSQSVPTVTNGGSDLCKNSITGGTKSAAQIIWDVAQACGINPQVLIVMLQKEQSLITDNWPWPIQYNTAMGYACPDTGPNNSANCNTNFFGFFNQVYDAAEAYRRYEANPTSYNYRANRNNFILYNPNTDCGGSTVFIENQATANLYIYTPYQPNTGSKAHKLDGGRYYNTSLPDCGAYGNINFFTLFNDYFGSPVASFNIKPMVYDNTTDVTGETATIGFSLTSKPSSAVTFDLTSSPSNFSTAEKKITISPDNWNRPEKNITILKGRWNPYLKGSETMYLNTGSLRSDDSRFNLSSAYTPEVPILHQDGSNEVYRLYDEINRSHIFTGSRAERDNLVNDGFRDEGVGFYGCTAGNVVYARLSNENDHRIAQYGSATYASLLSDGFSLDRLIASGSFSGKHIIKFNYNSSRSVSLYTLDANEGSAAGYTTLGSLPSCEQDSSPVYRLYSSQSKNHFYTTSTTERNAAREKSKYNYEGVAFYYTNNGTQDIFRLYSSTSKNHFYTMSPSERDKAIASGYRFEGVGFRINTDDSRDIFRLYSSTSKNHFYTMSPSERDKAIASGYRFEGVGFKAY